MARGEEYILRKKQNATPADRKPMQPGFTNRHLL